MWETKRAEELELAARDMEEVAINITITILIFNIIIIRCWPRCTSSRAELRGR